MTIRKYALPAFIIISLVLFSCGQGVTVRDYLRRLPKNDPNPISPYNEERLYKKVVAAFEAEQYFKAFDLLAEYSRTFDESSYDIKVNLMLAETIPVVLQRDAAYIETYYRKAYRGKKDAETIEAFLTNAFEAMGIVIVSNIPTYNNRHLLFIHDYDGYSGLKDDAYYLYTKRSMTEIDGPDSSTKAFMTNVRLLKRFVDRYPTSEFIMALDTNETYFGYREAIVGRMSASERKEYAQAMKAVNTATQTLTPETNAKAYVAGRSVRMRNRLPNESAVPERERYMYTFQHYNIVTVLRETRQYVHYRRAYVRWSLVKVDMGDGEIIGWTATDFLKPVSDIADDEGLIDEFNHALLLKNRGEYIAAAEALAQFIAGREENYFTDKAYYLLWEANAAIGALATSKDSEYYQYVKAHEKFYVYDRSMNALRCSNMIYEILSIQFPESAYKFQVNNQFSGE